MLYFCNYVAFELLEPHWMICGTIVYMFFLSPVVSFVHKLKKNWTINYSPYLISEFPSFYITRKHLLKCIYDTHFIQRIISLARFGELHYLFWDFSHTAVKSLTEEVWQLSVNQDTPVVNLNNINVNAKIFKIILITFHMEGKSPQFCILCQQETLYLYHFYSP